MREGRRPGMQPDPSSEVLIDTLSPSPATCSAAIPSLKPLFRNPRSKLVRYLLRAPWEQAA